MSTITSDNTTKESGQEAQHNNILAAKAVAQAVRTTLGPKGMDKMLVDEAGDVIVTNDGVTILTEMQIEHPAAKMVVEIAKTQEDVVGDGTTTAVIIAGELLKQAEQLLDQNIHPTVLAKGYRLAETESQKILRQIAQPVSINHNDLLLNIAITAMTGKGAEANKAHLADLLLQAVLTIASPGQEQLQKDNIKVITLVGDAVENSSLLKGIALDKERVHPSMPQYVENAKILLIDTPLEIKNTDIDAKIQITDPSQLNAFLEQEERTLKQMVDAVIATNANVVFCQRGIDEVAQHYLTKAGILAVRRVRKSDMEMLAKATGASIVSNLKEILPSDIGNAGSVKEEKIADEEMILVEQCYNPKALTILVKGGTPHIVEEIKRAIVDALGDIAAALKDGFVVAGAGAVEMKLTKQLTQYAQTLAGREQLAVQAYAKALEVIPRTLAENAGLDPINVLTSLHSSKDLMWPGINVFTGNVMDAWQEGVIEPLKVKTQALSSATHVAEMILRIDDVILRRGKE